MKCFKVIREVKQVFTIRAKDREDAFNKLQNIGTPKGFFETRIKSEKVIQKHKS